MNNIGRLRVWTGKDSPTLINVELIIAIKNESMYVTLMLQQNGRLSIDSLSRNIQMRHVSNAGIGWEATSE